MKSATLLAFFLAARVTVFAQSTSSTAADAAIQPSVVAGVNSNLTIDVSNSPVLPVAAMTSAEPASFVTNVPAKLPVEIAGSAPVTIPTRRALVWFIIGALFALAALVAGTRKPTG